MLAASRQPVWATLSNTRPGRGLLVQQLPVALPGQRVLLGQGLVHPAHPVERLQLGVQNDPVVRFGQEIIAAGRKTSGQILGVGQGGEENHRHQPVARQ